MIGRSVFLLSPQSSTARHSGIRPTPALPRKQIVCRRRAGDRAHVRATHAAQIAAAGLAHGLSHRFDRQLAMRGACARAADGHGDAAGGALL